MECQQNLTFDDQRHHGCRLSFLVGDDQLVFASVRQLGLRNGQTGEVGVSVLRGVDDFSATNGVFHGHIIFAPRDLLTNKQSSVTITLLLTCAYTTIK